MSKVQPRTLSGFMELLPARQVQFDRMVEILRKSYALLSQRMSEVLPSRINLLLIRFQLFQRPIQRFRIQFEFDGRHSASPPQTTSVQPRTRKLQPV